MDLLKVLCVCLFCVMNTCCAKNYAHRSSIFFTDEDPAEVIPPCHAGFKPCMIAARTFHSNGTLSAEFRSSNMCLCDAGDSCPSSWDEEPDNTVTRYLRTQGTVMTLQLKFCRPVQTERLCQSHEVALSLNGRSIVPQEVTSVNCRCPDNDPLYKQKVWYDRNALNVRNENYVCEMPQCEGANVPCFLYYRGHMRRETTYLCQCPGQTVCRNLQERNLSMDYVFGTCVSPTQPRRSGFRDESRGNL